MSSEKTIDLFEFEPIKGYPRLHWQGKRPFSSAQYFPAQKTESFGRPSDNWMNKIFWGDNLQVMSHLLKTYRGRIDLVYIDPPFDSAADYRKKIELRRQIVRNDQNTFEEKQYSDMWINDEYLQFIYNRIVLIRELMASHATIYFHCDTHKSHQLRCILDEVFGENNFVNEIIREKCNPKNYTRNQFGNIHDTIFVYVKNRESQIWNKPYLTRTKEAILNDFPIIEDGTKRRYKTRPIHAPGIRNGKTGGEWKGMDPPAGKHWQYLPSKLDAFDEEGKIEWSSTGNPRLKVYADESPGVFIQDIWLEMKDSPKLNYPTEKNEKLLHRIIEASSKRGDIVFDCFMGSGTTQAAAMKLGRKFIGADINLGSIQTTSHRLINCVKDIQTQQLELDQDKSSATLFTGFEVYNVNNYNIFRNEIEAKELLIEALEIQPLVNRNLYDGEKDGRMVIIMPINRIATRADLNQLITGFDRKTYDKRRDENPNQPVEKITLVCMGHEPDLAAYLKREVEYSIDVEVVDILRDNSELSFKRDSEADVQVKRAILSVKTFYPMNLLQKLSILKEEVEEWRELVDSIMIDWNYDGEVLRPEVIDVPKKDNFVKGEYDVPKKSSKIRIKITDILSESFEMDVTNG